MSIVLSATGIGLVEMEGEGDGSMEWFEWEEEAVEGRLRVEVEAIGWDDVVGCCAIGKLTSKFAKGLVEM